MTNQSKVAGRRSLRAILSTVIAILLIGSIFATTALADTLNKYDVTVIDNGKQITVTTTETEPIEILTAAGINLSDKDKLDASALVKGEGGKIVIDRCLKVNVCINGSTKAYGVYGDTVGAVLTELGITLNKNDKMNYYSTAKVVEGMTINIDSAFTASVKDGKKKAVKYTVNGGKVSDLLAVAGVKLGKDDYTEPAINTQLKKNMLVKVYRVEYKRSTKEKKIKYKTIEKEDATLAKGTKKVIQEGVKGKKKVTYRTKFVNGEKAKTKVVKETVIKEPVDQIVKIGTKKAAKKKVKKTKKVGTKKTTKVKSNKKKNNKNTSGNKFKGVELQYSARYDVSNNPLTSRKGVVYYNNHKETYYSQRVLPGNGLNIPGRHVADDGTVRDGDGYICVAANPSFKSKGTKLMTSLGPAKVYDCGCSYGTIDIYVNW